MYVDSDCIKGEIMRKSQVMSLLNGFEGDPVIKMESENGDNHISGIIEETIIQLSDGQILDRWLVLKACKVMVKDQ